MPKVTLSLSSEIAEILSKGGGSLSEKVKEIVTLYAERTSKAQERAMAVVEVLRELRELLLRIREIVREKSDRPESVDSEITSVLRLSKVALLLASSLPLTEGEKSYIAFLEELYKLLEDTRKEGYSLNFLFLPALILIIVTTSFLLSLIVDVATELKDLGDLKKHVELMDSLREAFNVMSNVMNLKIPRERR
jgi:hypothetical protein